MPATFLMQACCIECNNIIDLTLLFACICGQYAFLFQCPLAANNERRSLLVFRKKHKTVKATPPVFLSVFLLLTKHEIRKTSNVAFIYSRFSSFD